LRHLLIYNFKDNRYGISGIVNNSCKVFMELLDVFYLFLPYRCLFLPYCGCFRTFFALFVFGKPAMLTVAPVFLMEAVVIATLRIHWDELWCLQFFFFFCSFAKRFPELINLSWHQVTMLASP